MKAHIIDNTPEIQAAIQPHINKLVQDASQKGFFLGGHAAMQAAHDRYADRIRNGTPEESHAAALELLDYLTEKSEGLKGVGEGTESDLNSTGVEPSDQ